VRRDRSRNLLLHFCICLGVALSGASFTVAQDVPGAPPTSVEPSPEVRALGDSVHELQAEVQDEIEPL
jgi:hypothetical protein